MPEHTYQQNVETLWMVYLHHLLHKPYQTSTQMVYDLYTKKDIYVIK